MSEKIPISLRNSDLFLNPELTDGKKQQKEIENIYSLILKKGPSLGENNHLKSLYAFYLLTPLQASSYLNTTVTSYPLSSSFRKSDVKKLFNVRTKTKFWLTKFVPNKQNLGKPFEKTIGFKSENDNQETQDQKLKYKTTEVQNTYPLRYKLQTKYSRVFFDLNKLTEQKIKAELRKQYQIKAESFDTALNKIKSSTKSQSDQLSVQVVGATKPKQSGYFSLPFLAKSSETQAKQNKSSVQNFTLFGVAQTSFVHVQSFLRLYFYPLYFKSFLYKLNRGVCSGISQKSSIVAINLLLFSVLTIVQRSHYGKSSYNQKNCRTILCTAKLPNLTMWCEMSTEGQTSFLQRLWWYPKQKQLVGSFLGQSPISCGVNNNLGCTYQSKPLHFEYTNESLNARTKTSFLQPLGLVCTHPKFVCQNKNYQFKQIGVNNFSFAKPSSTLLAHAKRIPWCVDNKILLSTKHSERLLFKRKFKINSNLRQVQNFTATKVNQSKASVKEGYAIKPWYCIKASTIWDDQIIAIRSIKQAASTNLLYKQQLVPKFQYYIPYNISQQRIFAESDTIPQKRDSINSKIVVQENKNKLESSDAHAKFLQSLASELVLKRGFYKYGFFLIQSSESNKKSYSNSPGSSFFLETRNKNKPDHVKTNLCTSKANQNEVLNARTKTSFWLTKFVQNKLCKPKRSFGTCIERAKTSFLQPLGSAFVSALQRPQKGNVSDASTLNNYSNLALYKKGTNSFLETSNKKSNAALKSTFPKFVSSKKASFVSSMPIELRSKYQTKGSGKTFYKNRCLNELENTQKIKLFLSFLFSKINNLIKFTSTLVINKAFLSSGLTWSRYNLEKTKIVAFVQVRDAVLTFNFKPDTLLQNTSVSGYQFPELQKKEIAPFFRKIAIFGTQKNSNFYLYSPPLGNNIIFNQQEQTSHKAKKNLCSSICFCSKSCLDLDIKESSALLKVDIEPLSKSLVDLKMQYKQINLNEIESVKVLFERMGRNYEDYMRQPKDSLPALIISPSLEDDREIEEEGIRIFRKRDLLKKKNSKATTNSNSKDNTFLDNSSLVESIDTEKQNHQTLVKNALRQAQEEIDDIAKKEEKGGEKDKQVIPPLTRLEALYTIRQREKKYEQSKNLKREKSNAQAKLTFTNKSFPVFEQLFLYSDKVTTNSLNSYQFVDIDTPRLFLKLGDKKSNQAIQNTTNLSIVDANKSRTFVTRHVLKQTGGCKNEVFTSQKQSFCVAEAFGLPPYLAKQPFTCVIKAPLAHKTFGLQNFDFENAQTRFLQSTDRKHSFFGEMSLPAHKLTAQRQKQVFEQKANPLVTLNTKNTELIVDQKNRGSILSTQASQTPFVYVQEKPSSISFHSTVATVPFSCLSPLFVSSKNHNKKLESPRFQVGIVKTSIVPPETKVDPNDYENVQGFEDGTMSQQKLHRTSSHIQTKTNRESQWSSFSKSSLEKNTDQRVKLGLSDWVRGPSRIYFYDNLSQNKPCQGSIPKIKGVPLGSPVSHRVWQPKRMEPSTFRVLQRSQHTPVVPKISQNDWKNIIEWQLKKYFFEEDKRLRPFNNTTKTFKIKKINLYLPWISIKKALHDNIFECTYQNEVNQNFVLVRAKQAKQTKTSFWYVYPKADLNLTLIDSYANSLVNQLRLPENNVATTSLSFIKNKIETKQGFVVPLKNHEEEEQVSAKSKHHYTPINCQTNRYWRLPTRQNLFSIKTPLKAEIYGFKQNSGLLRFTQDFIKTLLYKKNSLNLQLKSSKQNQVRDKNYVFASPQLKKGVVQKVFKESFLFESLTEYSWLFIYAFASVLMFKHLIKWVYQAGLKDFFIKFLNSDFGRTITSEEFRYSIQNLPLKEFYTPNKRLQELFSLEKNKVQLLEIVWFLRNHCQGRHGPRGVLLVGPPGVENVSVVQAIAGEAKVPIIVQSLEKIAQDNEPQRQLEQLYMRAHKHAPCVLFLDQLDTIGARRDQLFTDKARAHSLDYKAKANFTAPETWTPQSSNKLSDAEPSIKNQNLAIFKNKLNVVLRLLTILDGITQSSGVVTVATARDITKLDPALLRPKRFDRRIYLSLPNRQDRIHLFKIQTQNLGHLKEMPWEYLSLQTENMSAADIQSAINYSLFRAVLKKSVHTVETLEYGIDCVKTLTEKRITNVSRNST